MSTLSERLSRETDHTPPLDRDGQPIYSTVDPVDPDSGSPLDAVRMSSRTLWNAADAKHVFALDQAADAILRDDALHASGATEVLATAFEPADRKARKRRAAQVAHLVRDELATHGIAVDITGLRPSRRVGSGRSARAIPGGYVERQYSQVVSSPRLSRKDIAGLTLTELAEIDADGSTCDVARHTSDLGEILSVTSIDPRRYAPTQDRKSHGARLSWSPRLRYPTPRRVKDSTIARIAGDGPTVAYVRTDRPARQGWADRHAGGELVTGVTELPGVWLDDERATFGHRVVCVPRKAPKRGQRNRSEVLADPRTVESVRAAVATVLASRKRETLTVLGRTVVVEPARRGTVRWETSSKHGQGKSPAAVAGRIIASVAR